MSKQLSLAQISNKTYSVQFTNIKDLLLSNLIQLIKKHHAKWNPIIGQYEIPIQQTSEFIKAARELDPKIAIKDVPGANLRSLLNHRGKEKDSRVVYILPRHKWSRILVNDPLLTKRYQFAIDFGAKKQQKGQKRVLLIFWQVMRKKWQKQLTKKRMAFQNVEYYELITPHELYKIGNMALKQPQFDLLTYQALNDMHQTITKSALEKYNSIFLDDSELWIEPENTLYKSAELGQIIRTLILNKISPSKDLLLLSSRFVLQKPKLALQIANLLLPRNFCFDAIAIAKGANDATWMKKRYVNESKYFRELMFIFRSLFYVNLMQTNDNQSNGANNGSEFNSIVDNYHEIALQDEDMRKFKTVDNRYKNVNKKLVISNFQSERSIGSYITNNASKFEQGKYIKDLRQTFTSLKLPQIFKFLYHLARDIKLKTIVVVQNQWGQQRLQKFMSQQQISHVVYQITQQQLQQPEMCYVNRQNPNPSVYLIVRDKLVQQYRAVNLQRQKNLEMAFQRQAEQELGIKRGGLFQINTAIDSPFSNASEILPLKKINNAHHILLVDTYWHDFSAEKEKIIHNIIDYKLPTFQQSQANAVGRGGEFGLIDSPGAYLLQKRRSLVRHFFTVTSSYQLTIIQKYLLNLQAHEEEMQQPQQQIVDIKSRFEQLCQKKKFQNKAVINQVLDIDQQFDKLEFEVLKQKQQQANNLQVSDQKPVYNTKIQGLVVETPHLDELKKFNFSTNKKAQQELKTQDNNILAALAQYNNQQEAESASQQAIDKYMITEEPQTQKACNKAAKQENQKENAQIIKNENMPTSLPTPMQNMVEQTESFEMNEEIIFPLKKQLPLMIPNPIKPSEQQIKAMRKVKLNLEKDTNKAQKRYQRDIFFKNIQSASEKSKIYERAYRSRGLWRNKAKEEKIIARKLMNLRVTLFEGKSSLNEQPEFDDEE